MNSIAELPAQLGRREYVDRLGVAASVLCAIHCALAPLLLLATPMFGRAWAHPASHWMVALFVIPLAIFSLRHSWHRTSRWVKLAGGMGIVVICLGAALPYLEAGEPRGVSACTDTCCPSVTTSLEGERVLSIPPASIVTTLGGLFLIGAHLGNLRACRQCPQGCCSHEDAPLSG